MEIFGVGFAGFFAFEEGGRWAKAMTLQVELLVVVVQRTKYFVFLNFVSLLTG